MDERTIVSREATMEDASMSAPTMPGSLADMFAPRSREDMDFIKEEVITRIGCGIAGFTDDEISPLFEEAHEIENIVLPPNW